MPADLNDWELLRYFLATARAGSFLAAAQALAASQPTVGRKVDQLEAKLGTKLLIRTSAGVDLTDTGRKVLRLAEDMEILVQSIAQEAAPTDELSGTIRFRGSDGIAGYWLPFMLSDFLAANPQISLHATCVEMSEMPNLSRREADITVIYREPVDPDVCVISRGILEVFPCTVEKYATKFGVPKTFDELLDHPVLVHDLYLAETGPFAKFAAVMRRHNRIVYRTNSSLALGMALRGGIGISLMPPRVSLREPDLMFIDLEGWTAKLPFWLVCHREVKDLPTVRAMIDYLKVSLPVWADFQPMPKRRQDDQ